MTFDLLLNISLLIDMIVNFRSAYYDVNLNLIENQKVLPTWFKLILGDCKELY